MRVRRIYGDSPPGRAILDAMRFTVIGHACLFIETAAGSILVDPWLDGSCYWRSWWHFPPNTTIAPEYLAPDYVYISHYHFDHFHFPSMRRLDRRARVLIPEFGVDVMRNEVRNLGFADVVELPHGKKVDLGHDVRVASFQYGADDSAIIVSADGVVLADLNDCKLKDRAAAEVLAAFGRPTFVLKSHSWAQAYPNCYTASDPRDLELLGRGDYAASFISTISELRPRYAIPFASMVGFLHPETLQYNAHAVTPPDVKKAFDRAGVAGSELVVMSPGDRWDSAKGFTLGTHDAYAYREKTLAQLAERVRPAIERAMAEEREQHADYQAFTEYMTAFARALPLPLRAYFRRPLVFHVASSPEPYWVVDVRKKAVRRERSAPGNYAAIFRMPEALLADSIAKRILFFVHISLRLSVELGHDGARYDIPFWGLLSVYEQGYFPLRHALRPRALRVGWRRRREVLQLVAGALRRRTFNEQIFGNLMTPERGGPS